MKMDEWEGFVDVMEQRRGQRTIKSKKLVLSNYNVGEQFVERVRLFNYLCFGDESS